MISDANVSTSKYGYLEINYILKPEYHQRWADLTKNNIGQSLAIIYDDQVFSAPRVMSEIPNGKSSITVNFTLEECKELANILKSGSLPLDLRIEKITKVNKR